MATDGHGPLEDWQASPEPETWKPDIPFGGCTEVLYFGEHEVYDFHVAAGRLLTCDHPHNYMVQRDGMRIYTSQLGVQCVKEALGL